MTLHPRPPRHLPPPQTEPARTGPDLFGLYVAEVVGPLEPAPHLTGWETRLWPVARLGDATFEARPRWPGLDEDDLRAALAQAGYTVLGPLRRRRR